MLTPCKVQSHIRQMMTRKNQTLQDIVQSLQIYRDNVDEDENADADGAVSQKEILQNLINYLQSC